MTSHAESLAASTPETPHPGSATGAKPLVWLLMGYKAGDNSQVLALGEALGWPYEIKKIVYTPYEIVVNLPICTTLAGVEKSRSSLLEPPWPDLVISAGRRNEPVCRWIKKAADKPVRLVHMGRPWAAIPRFDLVVTTPQYRLPKLPNVLHNEAPLHRVTRERLDQEAGQWRDRLADLPRPFVAVLAGGNSGPYPFDAESGARLGRQASALAERLGGSLLITTSARTPAETTEALFAAVTCPAYRFRWTPGGQENPYFAFLGLADRIVATGDSVSMMAEACATGKPVYLFDTGEGVTSMRRPIVGGHPAADEISWRIWKKYHLKAFIYRQTMRYGPKRLTRDIRIIQENLVNTGRAVWLGDEVEPAAERPPLQDVPRAVARLHQMFGEAAEQSA